MIISALIHHVILTLAAISIILNYWTNDIEQETETGKFIFIKHLDSNTTKTIPKIIVLIVGIEHILVTLWIISLMIFYIYLRVKKITAYQYKTKGPVKFNQVISDKQNAKG